MSAPHINQETRCFTLVEARELLPLIKSVCYRHSQELEPIQAQLNKMLSVDPRRNPIEAEYEAIVTRWKHKMEKLGVGVYSLWIIEFDVGNGVLCWRYPELDITHFRRYKTPFSSRLRLAEFIDSEDPDWAL